MTTKMLHQTTEEWQKEAFKLAGHVVDGRKQLDLKRLRFICPRCENVASAQEFLDLGSDPERAAVECIGRHDKKQGCDWCAFGLLGTLDGGRVIDGEKDDGTPYERKVFDFAPADA